MTLKCVIIDDEPLAREGMAKYVSEVAFLELVGTGSNPLELTKIAGEQEIDLLFLDIQMPMMNGIDYLKATPNPPMVIITTAYPSFALESFELDVLDYLVKPITFNRFFKAVNKANDYHQLTCKAEAGPEIPDSRSEREYFFVKCDYKYERIYYDEILFIQGMQNYVVIQTLQEKYMTLMALKTVEENLDESAFIRIHKSYIVAIDKIEAIQQNEIIVRDNRLPLGRTYRERVMDTVISDKLWKKT